MKTRSKFIDSGALHSAIRDVVVTDPTVSDRLLKSDHIVAKGLNLLDPNETSNFAQADLFILGDHLTEMQKQIVPFVKPNNTVVLVVSDAPDHLLGVLDFDAILPTLADDAFLFQTIQHCDRLLRRKRETSKRISNMQSKNESLTNKLAALDQELRNAQTVQQNLTSQSTFSWDGGQMDGFIRPRSWIGGDMVGFYPISEAASGFFAIDVSGHEFSAALHAARIAGFFLADERLGSLTVDYTGPTPRPKDPALILNDINEILFERFDTDSFFTCLAGHIDHQSRVVRFCQAGHPMPIIYSADKPARHLDVNGVPVGLLPGMHYETTEVELSKGEKMAIFSDGLLECSGRQPTDQFGMQRLEKFLTDTYHLQPSNQFNRISKTLQQFSGQHALEDDISLLTISIAP